MRVRVRVRGLEDVTTRVYLLIVVVAAIPTNVLPAPQGNTIMPDLISVGGQS